MDKIKLILSKVFLYKIKPGELILLGIIVLAIIIKVVFDWSYQVASAENLMQNEADFYRQRAAQYREMGEGHVRSLTITTIN